MFRTIRKSNSSALTCIVILLLGVSAKPQAPTAFFNGIPATIYSVADEPGFTPDAVTSDAYGNLYVADNSTCAVMKFARNANGYAAPTTILNCSGQSVHIAGLAADLRGDVYFSDYTHRQVNEIAFSQNGYAAPVAVITSSVVGSNFEPAGVAVDAAGNVFVSDVADAQILEARPNTSGNRYTVASLSGSTPVRAWNIAVDVNEDVFFGDTIADYVGEIPYSTQNSAYGAITQIANTSTNGAGFTPWGVAVDRALNVYIAAIGSTNQLIEVPWAGMTFGNQEVLATLDPAVNNISIQYGVTVDLQGDISVTEHQAEAVKNIRRSVVAFGTENIGNSSGAIGLEFTFASATTLSNKTPVQVLTNGISGLDFSAAAGSTCAATSYNAGDSCVVNVAFVPQFANARDGFVQLIDNNGNILATARLYGIGTGPEIAFIPGKATFTPTKTKNLVYPGIIGDFPIAVDGTGDIFLATASSIGEYPAGTSTLVTVASSTPMGHGFVPLGLAIDGGGNLYVSDSNGEVWKVAFNGSAYAAPAMLYSSNSSTFLPVGLAVDPAGDLYVSERTSCSILEIPSNAGSYGQPVTLVSLQDQGYCPNGIALDGAGDIYFSSYVGEESLRAVVQIPFSAGIYGTPVVLGTPSYGVGFLANQIAIDGAWNIYVPDTYNHEVLEMPWTGSAYGTTIVLASQQNTDSLFNPTNLTVDGAGRIFAADLVENQILVEDPTTPPILVFAATAGGSLSSDSPKAVTVANIGNADLFMLVPASGSNPSVTGRFSLDGSSTCPELTSSTSSIGNLAPNQTCSYDVDFEPTSSQPVGAVSGALTLADNNLNENTAQTVTLNGSVPTPLALSPGNPVLPDGTYGTSYRQQLSVSGGSPPYTYSIGSGSSLPAWMSLSADGVLSSTPSAPGAYTFAVQVTDSSSAPGPYTVSRQYTINVWKASIAVTLGNLSQPYSGSPLSVTATTVPTGLTVSLAYNSKTTAPTAAGSYSVTAAVNDPNYQGSASGTFVITPATLTVAANNATRLYGTSNPVLSGSVTGAAAGDSFAEAFTTTAFATSNAGTYPIVPTITGADLANYTVKSVKGTLTVEQAGTVTTVTASNSGSSVVLTAQVSSDTTGTPTGTVNFYDNGSLLSGAGLNAGSASIPTTLSAGVSHSIVATYSGDVNFSSSSAAAISVTASPLGFTFVSTGSSSATIAAGGTAQFSLKLTPTGGQYPSTVNFTASGLPEDATVTFSPKSVAATAGPQTVKVTIQGATQTSMQTPNLADKRKSDLFALAFLLLPLAGAGRLRRSSKRLSAVVSMLLLLVGLPLEVSLIGCGGSPSSSFIQQPANYDVTITATSGQVAHSVGMTLTVQ